jgi:hypothetical protein
MTKAQDLMNPYLENVLDLGRERMMRDYQGAMGDARRRSSDAAIQSGIMGGRGTLMGAREAGRVSDEAFRAMREFEADTRFGAFDRAQQAFASDVAARQAGARLGLDAGSQLQSLAQTQQAQALVAGRCSRLFEIRHIRISWIEEIGEGTSLGNLLDFFPELLTRPQ